jgi:hypothetical protein
LLFLKYRDAEGLERSYIIDGGMDEKGYYPVADALAAFLGVERGYVSNFRG